MTQPDRDRSEPRRWQDSTPEEWDAATAAYRAATQPSADSEGSAEPTTAAGRRFLVESLRGDPSKWADTPSKLMDRIAAIEAEARAASPVAESRLRKALRSMIEHDEEQRDNCGDWGTNTCLIRERARAALAAAAPPAADRAATHTPADSESSAEPTTEAGRMLLEDIFDNTMILEPLDAILAIEAEARAASPVAESGLLKAWEAVERFIEVRSTTITAEKAWEAWQDALLAAAAPPADSEGSAEPRHGPNDGCGELLWEHMSAEPGFSEDIRQAEAELAEGRGVPFAVARAASPALEHAIELAEQYHSGHSVAGAPCRCDQCRELEVVRRYARAALAARLASRDQED